MKTASKIVQIALINVLLATTLMGALAVKTVNAQAPYLQWATYYHNAPLLYNYPYGVLNQLLDIYKLKSDGTENFDWYFYLGAPGSSGMTNQVVPGMCDPWYTGWQTFTVGCAFYVYAPGDRELVDWDRRPTMDFGVQEQLRALTPQVEDLDSVHHIRFHSSKLQTTAERSYKGQHGHMNTTRYMTLRSIAILQDPILL
jgi:hypothetical protein